MDREQRKAVIAAYKERKQKAGIYLVRCEPTGACWIGGTLNLDAIRNRLWFTLTQEINAHSSLQQAWNANGGDAFAFEQIEHLDEELSGYAREDALKERLDHWQRELQAERI